MPVSDIDFELPLESYESGSHRTDSGAVYAANFDGYGRVAIELTVAAVKRIGLPSAVHVDIRSA